MLRPLPLALCLVFAACGTEPTPPPLDAPAPDVAPETGSDAAAEAGPDVEPDAPADQPVEVGPDAAPDLVTEAGVDATEEAPPDAPAEVGVDAAPEAGPDAAPDAPPSCPAGAVRCSASGGAAAIDYCVGGAWVGGGACSTILPPGTATVCAADTCVVCRRGDAGVGCSPEPLCAADAGCFALGLGRCVAGRCARRGAIPCATNSDCGGWTAGGTFATCAENPLFMLTRTCGSTAERCSGDAMCPATHRCDVPTGFCLAR